MIPRITLREALADPELLGNTISDESWVAWRVLLIAAMGEPLDDAERQLFAKLTGGRGEPGQLVEEFVGVIGRRGGKSHAISVLAAYIAALCSHPALVVRGERGVYLQDQKSASGKPRGPAQQPDPVTRQRHCGSQFPELSLLLLRD